MRADEQLDLPAQLRVPAAGFGEVRVALFGREVDLIMEGALSRSRRFAANVEAGRVPLYGA